MRSPFVFPFSIDACGSVSSAYITCTLWSCGLLIIGTMYSQIMWWRCGCRLELCSAAKRSKLQLSMRAWKTYASSRQTTRLLGGMLRRRRRQASMQQWCRSACCWRARRELRKKIAWGSFQRPAIDAWVRACTLQRSVGQKERLASQKEGLIYWRAAAAASRSLCKLARTREEAALRQWRGVLDYRRELLSEMRRFRHCCEQSNFILARSVLVLTSPSYVMLRDVI